MSKHIIVYHDHCNDGFGAAFIAHQHLVAAGHEVELIPSSYGDKNPAALLHGKTVHILDFSLPIDWLLELCEVAEEVIWLDHHKTAIDAWAAAGYMNQKAVPPSNLKYWLTTNHSGTMLAYMHYHEVRGQNLIPQWVKYIDDRDRWVFQYPETKAFHAGMSLVSRTITAWEHELHPEVLSYVLARGEAILQYQAQLYEQLMETAHEITIDGHKGLAANVPGQFASDLGHLLCKKSGTFGATYSSNGKGYKFSIRSEGDFDVSTIAKAFGGGGHRNAAGFYIEHQGDVAASGLTLWSTVDELTRYAVESGKDV